MKSIPWDGKKITKPGLYSGISLADYHRADICDNWSISSSGLRTIFKESPAHFFAEWQGNPARIERVDKRHFILGQAVHHLHLGQPNFAGMFVVQPVDYETDAGEIKPWSNNAKACRQWHEERRREGRIVLLPKEVEQIKGMAIELGRHPIIKAGALNGYIERSIFWRDKATGIWLKSRPDAIPGDGGDFVDLKSTVSVKWGDLVRSIGDYGYHAQGALVRDGARSVLDIKQPTFSLVFQEKTAPYCVRVVTLKDSDLDRGDRQNRAALETFAKCLKDKHWPGPGGDREDAETIELSEFSQREIDDRIKYGIS